jgi:hypothetical protein
MGGGSSQKENPRGNKIAQIMEELWDSVRSLLPPAGRTKKETRHVMGTILMILLAVVVVAFWVASELQC